MSLSPYINPTNLNGALVSSSKLGERIYPDGLDKRTAGTSEVRRWVTDAAETIKDASDAIANLGGVRSPMYVIGEIPSENQERYESQYIPDQISGLVRAISAVATDPEQIGVIIDGLGDVSGTLEVDFSKNPNVYRADEIVNNRVRKPSRLTMTVMVSNYLNDNLVGTVFDAVEGFDVTGWTNVAKNLILYGGNTRAQAALYKLKYLMENAKPFRVYTPHGVYDNMLIRSIKPHTTDKTMDMLYCDIDFEEIIFYAPYATKVGTQPARRGVMETEAQTIVNEAVDVASGIVSWTVKGYNKVVGLFGGAA